MSECSSSCLSCKADLDVETLAHLKSAGAAFGNLREREFDNRNIYISTNVKCSIKLMKWEQLANERPSWRGSIHTGVVQSEQERKEHSERLRLARKERQQDASAVPTSTKASTSQGGGQECIAFLTHLLVKILLKPTRKSRTETAKVTQ
ncbi:hypothetical protein P5673_015450 [Acropora cervicornis]|uniref:Uncharacterized protein n=1 Tax=Acropora cervicornis TaxID=6130 RepID=A0AAD9QHQ0_ACRCE|nr:hypothetical protein P5673_015450 [Acropora cervicornis]